MIASIIMQAITVKVTFVDFTNKTSNYVPILSIYTDITRVEFHYTPLVYYNLG